VLLIVLVGGSRGWQQAAGGCEIEGTLAASGVEVNEGVKLHPDVPSKSQIIAVHAGIVPRVRELGGESDRIAGLWDGPIHDAFEGRQSDHHLVEADPAAEGAEGELSSERVIARIGRGQQLWSQKVDQVASHPGNDSTNIAVGWGTARGWVGHGSSAPGILRHELSAALSGSDVGDSLGLALEVKVEVHVRQVVRSDVSWRQAALGGLERSVDGHLVRHHDVYGHVLSRPALFHLFHHFHHFRNAGQVVQKGGGPLDTNGRWGIGSRVDREVSTKGAIAPVSRRGIVVVDWSCLTDNNNQ